MSVRINSDLDRLERALWAGASAATGNPYTISFWAKAINDRGVPSSLFGLGAGGSDYLAQTDPNGLDLHIWNASSLSPAIYSITTGTWRHFAWTRGTSDGGNNLYIDGTLQIQASDFNTLSGVLLTIGYDQYGGEWFDAEFCDVRVWQTQLTSGEIAAELASTSPVKAGIYLRLRLADAATAATDSSGNSFTATVSGLSDGASEPSIYSGGGGGSVFPPVPAPGWYQPLLSLIAHT